MAAATPQRGRQIGQQEFVARITRDQRPELEQAIPGGFVELGNVTTLNSLKTDRKVKFYYIQCRGRITVGAGGAAFRAGPPLLGTPLYSLFQQISITGQHARYGLLTPIVMSGETMAEMFALIYPNWSPTFAVSVTGGPLVRNGALSGAPLATNDFDLALPIPLFPIGASAGDQVRYCIHGPDWAGNLNLNIQFADVTALGTPLATITPNAAGQHVLAFGAAAAGAGTALVQIHSVRPLLGKELMAKLKPALTFRLTDRQQITTALNAGAVAADQLLFRLTVGRDTTRIMTKIGTLLAATTAGVIVIDPLNDTFVTRTFPKLDDKIIGNPQALSDIVLQDYMGICYGRVAPIGYKILDFIAGTALGHDNVAASLASSQFGSERKFELHGDVAVVAATSAGEVIQEMTLDAPGVLQ